MEWHLNREYQESRGSFRDCRGGAAQICGRRIFDFAFGGHFRRENFAVESAGKSYIKVPSKPIST